MWPVLHPPQFPAQASAHVTDRCLLTDPVCVCSSSSSLSLMCVTCVCLDRRAEEFLGESGDEDERVADVGVSGEQRPLSLHCESQH